MTEIKVNLLATLTKKVTRVTFGTQFKLTNLNTDACLI
jgi:hypothetical protein